VSPETHPKYGRSTLSMLFGLLLCILGPGAAASEATPDPHFVSYVDWSGGRLIIEGRCDLEHPAGPKSRYDAEKRIEELLPEAFLGAVWELQVDSSQTMGDILAEEEELLERVLSLVAAGVKEDARYTRSMDAVRVRYVYPLFGSQGLAEALVNHVRSFPIRRVPGFVPTIRFSGIVIYAKGEYDQFSKDEKAALIPCLFPRIYDQEMRLVLEKTMCDPGMLRRWGMIGYTGGMDLVSFSPRIGSFPLTILARAIYGENGTDIIIPTESAAKLLALEANRRLLAEGRILVIYDDLAAPESPGLAESRPP